MFKLLVIGKVVSVTKCSLSGSSVSGSDDEMVVGLGVLGFPPTSGSVVDPLGTDAFLISEMTNQNNVYCGTPT